MPTLKQQGKRKTISATAEDRILTRVFQTEDGKIALAYLEAVFYNNSCFGGDNPHLTSYKVGQQDVIGFIKEAMNMVEGERGSRIIHPVEG